jgi:hypothetical protein
LIERKTWRRNNSLWISERGCTGATWGGRRRAVSTVFNLGRNEVTATLATHRLEMLWDAIEGWFTRHRDGEQPVWDETTLRIGQAIADGEFVCRLEVPKLVQHIAATDGVAVIHGWLDSLRQAFGTVIGIQLADSAW